MHTILDAPDHPTPRPTPRPYQKVFIAIEILLWACIGIGLLLKIMSWPYNNEIIVLAGATLCLFYMSCGAFLFGSECWRQHVGATLSGMVLGIGVMAIIFRIEYWEGASEMSISTTVFCAIVCAATVLLAVLRGARPTQSPYFYWGIFLRALVMILVSGTALSTIF